MKQKLFVAPLAIFVLAFWTTVGNTTEILSLTGSAVDNDGNEYSYSFEINDDNSDPTIFHAKLTNTSTEADPLIGAFAFNMNAILGTDFNFDNVVPTDWKIADSGPGVKFDYVGDDGSSSPDTRLANGQMLTFDFVFVTAPSDPVAIWTDAGSSKGGGGGLGGGDEEGQFAVKFQQLDDDGKGSDLLAGNYNGEPVPEPSTVVLLGLGIAGLVGVGRLRKKKKLNSD